MPDGPPSLFWKDVRPVVIVLDRIVELLERMTLGVVVGVVVVVCPNEGLSVAKDSVVFRA